MMVKKIAILGAGNGGMTAAADLKEQGFEISLYELPQFEKNLAVIRKKAVFCYRNRTKFHLKKYFCR